MTTAHITHESISTSLSSGPTIVDFWAPWCKPCVAISKEIERISASKKNVNIIKVNVDERPDLVQSYGIKSVPTIVYTDNKGSAPRSLNGFVTAEDLLRRMFP